MTNVSYCVDGNEKNRAICVQCTYKCARPTQLHPMHCNSDDTHKYVHIYIYIHKAPARTFLDCSTDECVWVFCAFVCEKATPVELLKFAGNMGRPIIHMFGVLIFYSINSRQHRFDSFYLIYSIVRGLKCGTIYGSRAQHHQPYRYIHVLARQNRTKIKLNRHNIDVRIIYRDTDIVCV